MDSILSLLNGLVGDTGSASLIFAGLAGITAAALALAVSVAVLGMVDPLRRRLSATGATPEVAGRKVLDLSRFVKPVAQYVLPQEVEEVGKIRLQLIRPPSF